MTDTKRGLIIFLAGLLTIALWVPLGNEAQPSASGLITTETYFGPFRYLTVRVELHEPHYTITPIPNYRRLALTAAVTVVLWNGVILWCRRRRASGDHKPPPQRGPEPE